MESLIYTDTPGPTARMPSVLRAVPAAAPQLGGLEGCKTPVVPFCGTWDKVQESTGSDRPSGHQEHMPTLLHHLRSSTWATKQVSCPTQDRPLLFHRTSAFLRDRETK